MYYYIYSRPLQQVAWLMLVLVLFWAFAQMRWGKKGSVWRVANSLLVVLALGVILLLTVFRERGDPGTLQLIPFYSFAMARVNREYYREMLMNVLLFLPFGLSLSAIWPERIPVLRRFWLTVLVGCGLSFCVELSQFLFKLGLAETDDVLTNTLGTSLGASQLLLASGMRKLIR